MKVSLPVIGVVLIVGLVCLPYSLSHGSKWPQFFHSLYGSTSHFLFPLAFLLMILPILYGHWNPLKPFFENSLFQFISKITFACYMVHYPYLVWRSLAIYTTPYMSGAFGLVYGFTELIPILGLGLVVAVVYEFPIAAIFD